MSITSKIIISGEPVAKSTMKPPRGKNKYWIVSHYDLYLPLRKTWAYQKHVAECAMLCKCHKFDKDDPIRISANIYKSGRKTGDRKNIIAAIEDGLQYGGFIPNDRQITSSGVIQEYFNQGKDNTRVEVILELEPMIEDLDWLTGWLGSKKKALKYLDNCL